MSKPRMTVRVEDEIQQRAKRYVDVANRVGGDKVSMSLLVEVGLTLVLELAGEVSDRDYKMLEYLERNADKIRGFKGKSMKEIARAIGAGIAMGNMD